VEQEIICDTRETFNSLAIPAPQRFFGEVPGRHHQGWHLRIAQELNVQRCGWEHHPKVVEARRNFGRDLSSIPPRSEDYGRPGRYQEDLGGGIHIYRLLRFLEVTHQNGEWLAKPLLASTKSCDRFRRISATCKLEATEPLHRHDPARQQRFAGRHQGIPPIEPFTLFVRDPELWTALRTSHRLGVKATV
jgi:hypothetical protein